MFAEMLEEQKVKWMRRLYEEVLEQLNKVKKQIPEESEYVKALILYK